MTDKSLPPVQYSGRIEALRMRLETRDIEALMVTEPMNVRWLTGFTGSNGSVAVLPDRAVLITDGRYRERALAELAEAGAEAEVRVGLTAAEQHQLLVEVLSPCRAVGAESEHLTQARWASLASELHLVAADRLVEVDRRGKDDGEVARMAAAATAADAALAAVAPHLAGMTEHEVRTELDYQLRQYGADGAAYDTIVASGAEHAARPHHDPSRRRIEEGDLVIIDVGGVVDGYRSDMTRSYVIGDPTPTQRELYELVACSQRAGLAALGPDVPAAEVDAACRQVFIDAGYADWFLHGTGHGVGLAIHEAPMLNRSSCAVLHRGDVVTVEPGLYRVGIGGIRIEDLAVVTDTGCRILTTTPKEDLCLPSPPTI